MCIQEKHVNEEKKNDSRQVNKELIHGMNEKANSPHLSGTGDKLYPPQEGVWWSSGPTKPVRFVIKVMSHILERNKSRDL